MRIAIFALFAITAFAQQPDKKAPPEAPKPPVDRQVAEQVSALLHGSAEDPGAWCKTPIVGLLLAQEKQQEKSEPKPEPNAPK